MKRLYARHRLDIRPGHLLRAAALMTRTDATRAAGEVQRTWSPDGSALACYSVRSGFHLPPLAATCRRHGILLVEDCAQSFAGPPDTGDELAVVSMFSFGILKTATALGGAMMTVRDPLLLARMRTVQGRWQLQSRRSHLKRIAQTAAFVVLNRPRPYAFVARMLGASSDGFVNSAAKAFPAG